MPGQKLFPPRVPAIVATAPDRAEDAALAAREIEIWTTRDGREIPLEDMTNDHVANALRVLTHWRAGLRRTRPEDPVITDLSTAIERFKHLDRDRRRAARRAATGNTGFRPVEDGNLGGHHGDSKPDASPRTATTSSRWPKRPMRPQSGTKVRD